LRGVISETTTKRSNVELRSSPGVTEPYEPWAARKLRSRDTVINEDAGVVDGPALARRVLARVCDLAGDRRLVVDECGSVLLPA
jgi:hypothetical protein